MKLYGLPHSRSFRVLWALEEAGMAYEYERVDFASGQHRSPEFRSISPGGKVPAIDDNGIYLTESSAICTYIGDQSPASGLVPEVGTLMRARYNQWCNFALSELEQPLWTIGKHRFAIPAKYRVPAIMETARWEFTVACDLLAKGLGDQPHILGEQFTAADILLAHTLSWARSFKVPSEQPALDTYLDRLMQRPAYQRAQEKEKSMKAMQASAS